MAEGQTMRLKAGAAAPTGRTMFVYIGPVVLTATAVLAMPAPIGLVDVASALAGCGTTGAINGTSGSNTLNGTSGNDIICGHGGNDTIYGHGGNDIIYGGDGNDTIYGGSGTDTIHGDSGDDYLKGETGNDTVYGDYGADRVYGDQEADTLLGGPGNDSVLGGPGNDRLRGEGDRDTLDGEGDTDDVRGGSGTDTCRGGSGNTDSIYDFDCERRSTAERLIPVYNPDDLTCGPNDTTCLSFSGFSGQSVADYPLCNKHNCTAYAAFRLYQRGLRSNFPSGNAYEWNTSPGVLTAASSPVVGDIAHWDASGVGCDANATNCGHVAYVERVNYSSSGTISSITISESKWCDGGAVRGIAVGTSGWPTRFLRWNR
jgi:RTX calcium-binding nonapeptide repeat (4 copies)/CHAP domain